MNPFHTWKISKKLIVLIVLVSGITVLLGFTALAAVDYFNFKRNLKQEHTMHARLIGTYCVAPLTFEDVPGANEILAKSLTVSSIEAIYLYNAKGTLFTHMDRSNRQPRQSVDGVVALSKNDKESLHIIEPIHYQDTKYGSVYIRVSKEPLTRQIIYRLTTLCIALVILSFLSFFLAGWLQKFISRPILNLASLARKVAANEDYSLRATKTDNDEVGILAEDMNNMLEQIALREDERDIAENELKDTRDYLRNLFDSLSSMVISIDESCTIIQWNNTAEQWTSISSNNAVGQDLTKMDLFLNRYNKSIRESLDKQRTVHLQHVGTGNPDNKYYNISVSPLSYGPNRGAVIRAGDVTEFVRQDTEIRQAQKMDTIGNLAGGLAHDFNNVLVGIVGTVSMMEATVGKPNSNPDTLSSLIKIISESSERARHLVKQLLTISHKQELRLSKQDLSESVSRIAELCRSTFDKRIEIIVKEPLPKAIVFGDSTQLEQVLLNVCLNASHAMTSMRKDDSLCGGTLSIALDIIENDDSFLKKHTEAAQDNYFRISIQDTGVGISESIVSKIFDPFFSTKDNGTGLGLSMVYNIIHQHKGFIDFTSQKGKGTNFAFYLPAQKETTQPPPIERSTNENALIRGTGGILLVDDEEVVRKVATGMLETCGYSTISANNGIEGIELFKENHEHIDMVLLDMMMPKMSGLQTYVELKKIDPNVKVIVASGFKLDKRVQATLKLGANDFLQKPYTMTQLSQKIAALLSAQLEQ